MFQRYRRLQFCYQIFIIINFSLKHPLQKENFEILKNSLHRELW